MTKRTELGNKIQSFGRLATEKDRESNNVRMFVSVGSILYMYDCMYEPKLFCSPVFKPQNSATRQITDYIYICDKTRPSATDDLNRNRKYQISNAQL